MTIFPCNTLLTAGSDKVLQSDPHGWILTFVCVSVVFAALFVLWGLYTLSGAVNTGKFKRKGGNPEKEADDEIQAAVATALHLYLSESIHDKEPGVITILKTDSPWRNKSISFRQKIR